MAEYSIGWLFYWLRISSNRISIHGIIWLHIYVSPPRSSQEVQSTALSCVTGAQLNKELNFTFQGSTKLGQTKK